MAKCTLRNCSGYKSNRGNKHKNKSKKKWNFLHLAALPGNGKSERGRNFGPILLAPYRDDPMREKVHKTICDPQFAATHGKAGRQEEGNGEKGEWKHAPFLKPGGVGDMRNSNFRASLESAAGKSGAETSEKGPLFNVRLSQ